MRVRLLLAVAAVLALSGCTEPDGMPDFKNPSDPDNLIILDEEGLAGLAVLALTVAGLWLALRGINRNLAETMSGSDAQVLEALS